MYNLEVSNVCFFILWLIILFLDKKIAAGEAAILFLNVGLCVRVSFVLLFIVSYCQACTAFCATASQYFAAVGS